MASRLDFQRLRECVDAGGCRNITPFMTCKERAHKWKDLGEGADVRGLSLLDRAWAPNVLLEGTNRRLSLRSVQAIPLLDYLSQDVTLSIDPGKILIVQFTPMGPNDGVHLIPAMLDLRPVHDLAPNSEFLAI